MSLQQKLLNKIQTEGRVTYGALCQLTMEEGYKIATMDRRLREHAAEGKICPVMARSKRNTEYISAYTAEPIKKPVHNFIFDEERQCMVEVLVK